MQSAVVQHRFAINQQPRTIVRLEGKRVNAVLRNLDFARPADGEAIVQFRAGESRPGATKVDRFINALERRRLALQFREIFYRASQVKVFALETGLQLRRLS